MFYPTLSPENTSRDFIDVFGGYNHNVRIGENEFFDMKNLSSDMYPLLATRHKRKAESSPPPYMTLVGMIYCSELYRAVYVRGDYGNYIALCKGQGENPDNIWQFPDEVDDFSESPTVLQPRNLIMTGAYLIILPDKKYINLAKYDDESADHYPDKGNIEAEITIAENTLSVQPCLADGTVVNIDYAGSLAPESPADGCVWLDTSTNPPMLKKWYGTNSMWVEQIGGYVRLYKENGNISADFAEGDALRVSGFSGVEFVNGLSMVKAKPDNDTLVVTADTSKTNYDFTFFEPVGQNSKAEKKVITHSQVQANAYQGDLFLIGGTKATCLSNRATVQRQEWIISDDNFTNISQTVTTINSVQTKSAGQYIYVDLADGEQFVVDVNAKNYRVQIGEYIGRLTAVGTTSQGAWISTNIDVTNVPASTVIYLMEYGNVEGEYEMRITFDRAVKHTSDTAIMLYPDLNIQQSNAVTLARKMPIMDHVVESKNRLWGCYYGENADGEIVNEIYASKLGDFKNWQCYEGLSTDSYAASCGTDGAWTGAITYMGSPLFFKENYIHTVSGSFPAQFQINSVEARGVKENCAGSLAVLDETLFYLSNHGICTYNGGFPTEISEAFGDIRYKDAQAGVYNGKYYISMKEDSASENPPSVLMVYDKKRGLWHKEDDLAVVHFCTLDDDLLYVTENNMYGSVYGGTEETPIQWYAETGIYGLSMIDSKYISRLNIRLALDMGSHISVSIDYDSSGMWEKLCFVQGHSLKPFTLPIKPRRCDHFRLRLEGTGNVKIYSISKTLMQGSDL